MLQTAKYSVAPNNGSWAWNFTKSFFTFAGGPGNVPTCAGQALGDISDDLVGEFKQSLGTAENLFKGASTYQAAKALRYAAGRPNSWGGVGLICPECSSTFKTMTSLAEGLGDAVDGLFLLQVSAAANKARNDTIQEARTGQCAAAFPIF